MAYEYTLTLISPVHIARGRSLYAEIWGASDAADPGETINFAHGTEPTGLTVTHDTLQFWHLCTPIVAKLWVKFVAAADAPLGAASITFTGTSAITSEVRTCTINLIIEEMPAELETPQFDDEQEIDAAAMTNWETKMVSETNGGPYWGATANIVAPGDESGTWFYDGAKAFHRMAEYAAANGWASPVDPTSCYALADNVRAKYLLWLQTNHTPSDYRVFSHGFRLDSERRAIDSEEYADDVEAIGWLAYGDSDNPAVGVLNMEFKTMRGNALALEACLDALAVGAIPHAAWTKYVDNLIGFLDVWCRVNVLSNLWPINATYPGYFVQPFIGGLAASALIRYYDYTVAQHAINESNAIDTRVIVAVRALADWLMFQDADQATKTDIEVDDAEHEYDPVWHFTRVAIRSVASPFVAADNGKSIHITAGTNWTPGHYVITSEPDEDGWVMVEKTLPFELNTECSAVGNANLATGHVEEWNAWSPGYKQWAYCVVYNDATVSIANQGSAVAWTDYVSFATGEPTNNLLAALICPMYAWLYSILGEADGAVYREWGDMAFAAAFPGTRTFDTGKEFSEAYRSTFDYIAWRTENDWNSAVSRGPTRLGKSLPLSSFCGGAS